MDSDLSQVVRLGGTVTGIAAGSGPDTVVVTQTSGVLLYSLARQEKLAGWRLDAPGQIICAPATHNTHADTLHAAVQGAVGGQQLLSWSCTADEGNLSRAATITALPKPVHSIHSAASSAAGSLGVPDVEAATGVFIVYADGSVALDTFYRNGQVRAEVGGKGRAEAASAAGGRLAVLTSADLQQSLLTIYQAKGKVVEEVAALPLARRDSPSGLSMDGTAVVAVWSDGGLQTFALRSDDRGRSTLVQTARRQLAGFTAEQDEVAVKALRTTEKNGQKGAAQTGKRKSRGRASLARTPPCIAVALQHGQAAVLGWTGEGTAAKLRVVILDSSAGVPRGMRDISAKALSGAAADSPLQAAPGASGTAVLAAGSLLSLQLEGPRPTLAAQLGSLSTYSGSRSGQLARLALHPEHLSSLLAPLQSRQAPRWMPAPVATHALPQGLFSEVAIPIDTRDSDASSPVDAVGLRQLAELQAQVFGAASPTDATVAAFVKACKQSTQDRRAAWVPDTLAAQLLFRLAESGHWVAFSKVWAQKPLASLTLAPGLLPLLARAGQHRLLSTILPTTRDTPAEDLQESLQMLLRREPGAEGAIWHSQLKALATQAVEQADSQAAAGSLDRESLLAAADAVAVVHRFSCQEVLLHPLVAARVDDVLLGRVLRSLNAPHALRLARYLHKWLANFTELEVSRAGGVTAAGAALPPMAGVVRWLNRLLDTHVIGMAMAPAATKLAKSIQEVARANLEGAQVLGPLLGALQHVQHNQPLPAKPHRMSDYSIEVFHIGIRS